MHNWFIVYSPTTKEACYIYVVGSAVDGFLNDDSELIRAFFTKNANLEMSISNTDEFLDKIFDSGGIILNRQSEMFKQNYIASAYNLVTNEQLLESVCESNYDSEKQRLSEDYVRDMFDQLMAIPDNASTADRRAELVDALLKTDLGRQLLIDGMVEPIKTALGFVELAKYSPSPNPAKIIKDILKNPETS